MKVKLTDGREACIYFTKKHRMVLKELGVKNNSSKRYDVIDTTCCLMVGEFASCLAEACQNPKDRYSKVTGKKIALTRVLKLFEFKLSKIDRAIIWKTFCDTYIKKNVKKEKCSG